MSDNILSRSIQTLQAIDVGAQSDRTQVMNMAVLFNCIVGVGFLLATFFQSYSAAMGFHATTTAMAHLALCVAVNQWLKRPDLSKIDILGGIALLMDLMLLQTTILWSSLASGVVGSAGGLTPAPCLAQGSGGDRAVSAFAGILFVTQLGTQALAYMWRGDWLGASGVGGYGPIQPDISFQGGRVPPPSGRGAVRQGSSHAGSAASTAGGVRDGFLDTDPEVGL